MDQFPICPRCHVIIRPTDYFCSNCGSNLRPSLPSVSLTTQIILYLKSFFLPPMGIFWGLRYLRQPDSKSKYIGLAAIIITIVSIYITLAITSKIFNEINNQVNQQMNQIQGF